MTLNTRYFVYYDFGLILIAVLILFLAYRKGFVRQLTDVTTYLISLIVSILLSPELASVFPIVSLDDKDKLWEIVDKVTMPVVNIFLWFLILFIGLRILYRILAFVFSSRKKTKLSLLNHLLGLGLGMIKVFLLGITLTLVLQCPLIRFGDEFVQHSVLRYVEPSMDILIDYWEGEEYAHGNTIS